MGSLQGAETVARASEGMHLLDPRRMWGGRAVLIMDTCKEVVIDEGARPERRPAGGLTETTTVHDGLRAL